MKIPGGVEVRIIKTLNPHMPLYELYIKGKLGVQKVRLGQIALSSGGESLEIEDPAAIKVIKKMIQGVTTGFQQKIKINGVGYKAQLNPSPSHSSGVSQLELSLGYKDTKVITLDPRVGIVISGNGLIIEGKSTS